LINGSFSGRGQINAAGIINQSLHSSNNDSGSNKKNIDVFMQSLLASLSPGRKAPEWGKR
jgi:hypothetical protein